MVNQDNSVENSIKSTALLNALQSTIQGTEWEGKVFVAGGWVRDKLRGHPSKDIDLVVTSPNGGVEFAAWICRKFGVFSAGNPVLFPRFGTAKFNLRGLNWRGVDIGDIDIEAVMPRSEVYEEGSRKPEVNFASLREDAERRDFTINSLMWNVSTGEVLDLTKRGYDDLKDNIIRSAIPADEIFAADPLRMLRAIRFAVRFDAEIDGELIERMYEMPERINDISFERIQEELCKILVSRTPSRAFRLLQMTDLLKQFLPELDICKGVTQNHYHKDDVFDHILAVVDGSANDLVVRLACLFHDIGKPAVREVDETGKVHFHDHENVGAEITRTAMERLRFSNEMTNAVVLLVQNHMRLKKSGEWGEKATPKTLRKIRRDLGDLLEPLLLVMDADNKAHATGHTLENQIDGIRDRFTLLQNEPVKVKLPVNGNDVMEITGLDPGPIIKTLLGVVEEAWLDNPEISRDECLEIVCRSFAAMH
jgi:poly(A) polymerase